MGTVSRQLACFTRHALYAAFLASGLVAGFVGAVRSASDPGYQIPAVHVPVLAFVIVAAAALLLLRPLTAFYSLGLLCLLLGLVGFWLASPNGLSWAGRSGYDLPQDGRPFGYFLLFLFPAGWFLLSASVTRWWSGIVSYFGAGLVFVLLNMMSGLTDSFLLPLPWLFWPHFTLAMLGMFGWEFN